MLEKAKRHAINIAVTAGQRQELRRAARRAGMPTATWLRWLGLKVARGEGEAADEARHTATG